MDKNIIIQNKIRELATPILVRNKHKEQANHLKSQKNEFLLQMTMNDFNATIKDLNYVVRYYNNIIDTELMKLMNENKDIELQDILPYISKAEKNKHIIH